MAAHLTQGSRGPPHNYRGPHPSEGSTCVAQGEDSRLHKSRIPSRGNCSCNAAAVSEEKETQTSPSSATGTLDFPSATPVPLLSVAAPRKPKLNDKECQVCHILYRTQEDMANPLNNYWLSCSVKNCRFCVHAACSGVYYPNTHAGKKAYDSWAPGHYFCKTHMARNSKMCLICNVFKNMFYGVLKAIRSGDYA